MGWSGDSSGLLDDQVLVGRSGRILNESYVVASVSVDNCRNDRIATTAPATGAAARHQQ